MNATIKKQNFIKWYFHSGSDQEFQDILLSIGNQVADEMEEGKDSLITIESLWDCTEKDIIPCCFFEEFPDDNYDEISLYSKQYDKIVLI